MKTHRLILAPMLLATLAALHAAVAPAVSESPTAFKSQLQSTLNRHLNQLLKSFSETIFQGNYEAPASFGIGLSRKDVGLANELGRRLNVPMPIAALVEQIMIEAINRGWSDQSTASLFRLQEEAAGIEVRRPQK